MQYRSGPSIIAAVGVICLAGGLFQDAPRAAAQGSSSYKAPRTAYGDGKADLNGIWQAINTANWDLESHSMAPGPLWQLGAIGGVPPGQGVVEGGAIPYQPWAAAKKKENFQNRLTADVYKPEIGDPELKCYSPGIPRA